MVKGMDVNDFLEILGNESRRKILALLAKKPCYVSEISYSLKMAPKAVIEHLEKLEKAGIIRSFEEGRRRYYYIDRNFRIEISITPHDFKTYLISETENIDTDRIVEYVRRIQENMSKELSNFSDIYRTLREFEEIQHHFSRIQNLINKKITEMFERLISEIERSIDDDLEKLVLLGITKGINSIFDLSEVFGLPYKEIERAINKLKSKGIIEECKIGDNIIFKIKC